MTSLVATATMAGTRVQARLARWVGRPMFWILFVGAICAWPIARSIRLQLPPKLPHIAQVPAFQLTDEKGRAFGSSELEGKVWVANFIFTRCPTVCPRFTEKMSKVQHRTRNLGGAFHLVSFS